MYYETLILGLVMGCIYTATALGVNIIYGIMKIVNWASGQLLMIAMFIVWGAVTLLGINPYLTLLIVVPVMFGFGYLFQSTGTKSPSTRRPVRTRMRSPVMGQFQDTKIVLTYPESICADGVELVFPGYELSPLYKK